MMLQNASMISKMLTAISARDTGIRRVIAQETSDGPVRAI